MRPKIISFSKGVSSSSTVKMGINEPAQPLFNVLGMTDVTPFEALVIAQTNERIGREVEIAQKQVRGLRERVKECDCFLSKMAMEYNGHHNYLKEQGFPTFVPYGKLPLILMSLMLLFLSEITLTAAMLAGAGLEELETFVVATGIAIALFWHAKAMATAVRRLESGDSDRKKEYVMIVFGGLAAFAILIGMLLVRYEYQNQAVETAKTANQMEEETEGAMHGNFAVVVALSILQLGCMGAATFIIYVSLPRDRRASECRTACSKLANRIAKLLKARVKWSSRYNAVQRACIARVEMHKAYARRLIADYFMNLNTRGGGNLGRATPWREIWFPPVSLGGPLDEHPSSLDSALENIANE